MLQELMNLPLAAETSVLIRSCCTYQLGFKYQKISGIYLEIKPIKAVGDRIWDETWVISTSLLITFLMPEVEIMFWIFQAVCNKMGLNTGDRLSPESIKRKFLVSSLPDDKVTHLFTSFNIYFINPWGFDFEIDEWNNLSTYQITQFYYFSFF